MAALYKMADSHLKISIEGDPRVNLNPEILTAETVFLRLHTWVVMELRKLNPQLKDDERLYQTARKIVIAKYQHVIMKEYVPIILGIFRSNQVKY